MKRNGLAAIACAGALLSGCSTVAQGVVYTGASAAAAGYVYNTAKKHNDREERQRRLYAQADTDYLPFVITRTFTNKDGVCEEDYVDRRVDTAYPGGIDFLKKGLDKEYPNLLTPLKYKNRFLCAPGDTAADSDLTLDEVCKVSYYDKYQPSYYGIDSHWKEYCTPVADMQAGDAIQAMKDFIKIRQAYQEQEANKK